MLAALTCLNFFSASSLSPAAALSGWYLSAALLYACVVNSRDNHQSPRDKTTLPPCLRRILSAAWNLV